MVSGCASLDELAQFPRCRAERNQIVQIHRHVFHDGAVGRDADENRGGALLMPGAAAPQIRRRRI